MVLGRRRARAAALLTLSLPGGAYVYRGDELGLPEVQDLPDALIQDPTFTRSGGLDRGRDGCRIPLPWQAGGRSLGFSPDGAEAPWLPQPAEWADLSVSAQEGDPDSFLSLYRTALALRRERLGALPDALVWADAGPDAVCFDRGAFRCVVNLGEGALALPEGAEILLASGPLDGDGRLPRDTAVWLTR
ncbi:DUF3459 domain-containing protein [Streptomyces sp. NPDC005761]|uniref:alpha-amylase family glycosyl hydrolase n=1 Tax=Streptomyces sp. NPDC005761 TaxID=3157066 RepID=UPI0033D4ED5D